MSNEYVQELSVRVFEQYRVWPAPFRNFRNIRNETKCMYASLSAICYAHQHMKDNDNRLQCFYESISGRHCSILRLIASSTSSTRCIIIFSSPSTDKAVDYPPRNREYSTRLFNLHHYGYYHTYQVMGEWVVWSFSCTCQIPCVACMCGWLDLQQI